MRKALLVALVALGAGCVCDVSTDSTCEGRTIRDTRQPDGVDVRPSRPDAGAGDGWKGTP